MPSLNLAANNTSQQKVWRYNPKYSLNCINNHIEYLSQHHSSDYMSSTTNGEWYENSWTLHFWIKPVEHVASHKDPLLFYGDSANDGITVYLDTNQYIIVQLDSGTHTSVSALTDSVWSNVVVVYDAKNDTLKIYINGSEDYSQGSVSYDPDITNTLLNIMYAPYLNIPAGESFSTRLFNGRFFEVAIYNFALTNLNVTKLYNGGDATDLRRLGIGNPQGWWSPGNHYNDWLGTAWTPNSGKIYNIMNPFNYEGESLLQRLNVANLIDDSSDIGEDIPSS